MPTSATAAQRMDQIPFSGIREIFEECDRLEAEGRDIIHLEIGRPDFDTPEPIKTAAKEAIDAGYVHYTSNYGIKPLRRAIADEFRGQNGLDYNPDREVVVTTGATEAVMITVMALADPGEEVLIPDPSWTYAPHIRMAGATPIRYQLEAEEGFRPDPESLADAVTDQTSLLVVNSPQNPTGSVLDDAGVEAVRDVAVEHDLTVLSDEIYEKLCYDDATHQSLATEPDLRERTVTVNGVSKAYSMTGWRLGYLGAPEHLIDPIVRMRQYTTTCAPSISQHAAVRALGSDLHEPLVAAFAERRDRVADWIERVPGMDCPTPQGAFYAFPTLPDGHDDDYEFAFTLLREAGVATVPGSVFGGSGDGRIRIAFSNSLDQIDEAFERLLDWY